MEQPKPEEQHTLTEEDKLIFNLSVIGNIKINEKLMSFNNLLKVDDRWFQGIRRKWSNDSIEKCLEHITATCIAACKKVEFLVNHGERDDILSQNQIVPKKALLHSFLVNLSNSKKG